MKMYALVTEEPRGNEDEFREVVRVVFKSKPSIELVRDVLNERLWGEIKNTEDKLLKVKNVYEGKPTVFENNTPIYLKEIDWDENNILYCHW